MGPRREKHTVNFFFCLAFFAPYFFYGTYRNAYPVKEVYEGGFVSGFTTLEVSGGWEW